MVIAALVSFGILLVAWIAAPLGEQQLEPADAGHGAEVFAEGIAPAA